MAEIRWIKLTTSMFEDEKIKLIEAMPDADSLLVIWVKLLTLAGRCNANGFIMLTNQIPYTEEMLSTVFGRPVNTVRLAFSVFRQFGMVDTDDGAMHISNWEKHQNIEGMDRVREQARLRMAASRAKRKALPQPQENVAQHVTQRYAPDIDIEGDKESIPPIPPETGGDGKKKRPLPVLTPEEQMRFDAFYTSYPKKRARDDAIAAWIKIERGNPRKHMSPAGVDGIARLMRVLEVRKLSKEWVKECGQFVPYPASWLNSGDWKDESVTSEPVRRVNMSTMPTMTR